MNKILTTPIRSEDLEDIQIGDVLYLDGHLVTCRDVAHRRLIEYGLELPVNLQGGAIFHAGPIVRKIEGLNDKFEMVSIGPTTSSRMEKYENKFIRETGVKLIVGKGGMGKETMDACQTYKAIHCIFPAGCAVLAATAVEEIESQAWMDLGMPETLWICRVKNFGPLIVSIDTHGNNIYENNKIIFNERRDRVVKNISEKVKYIR